MEKFHYAFSHELDQFIEIKICSVDGACFETSIHDILASSDTNFVRNLNDTKRNEPCVVCQVFCDGQPLCLPVSTSYKSFSDRWAWNEWITLPLRYRDIPRHAVLAFSIHEMSCAREIRTIGSSTISIFAPDGTLRRGICDLKIWPKVSPDVKFDSTTCGKVEISSDENLILPNSNEMKKPTISFNDEFEKTNSDELNRIAKLIKSQRDGHVINQEWLESLSLEKVRSCLEHERANSKSMLLIIEFTRTMIDNVECTVLYHEPYSDDIILPNSSTDMTIEDPEIDLENIVECKHMTLTRSGRKEMHENLTPTREQNEQLRQIIGYAPGQSLSAEEQDLVWEYRFFLAQNKKALAKFLQCVRWDKEEQVKQALDLLQRWAEMDIEDALELLGPSSNHPKVRAYAVSRLRQTSDEDLTIYLLQLVQALRYESASEHLVETINDEQINNENTTNESLPTDSIPTEPTTSTIPDIDLSTFLIQRACEKPIMSNYLLWYSYVESESATSIKDRATSAKYEGFIRRLSSALNTKNERTKRFRSSLNEQRIFVEKLIKLTNIIKNVHGTAKAKEDELKILLEREDSRVDFDFRNFNPIPLPFDPDVYIRRIIPGKSKVFKSNKMPFLFVCETTEGKEYPLIFKNGDDLRQDQLILQIITLMDRILRSQGIDLKLTPYKAIATGITYGFVQFIDSVSLGSVIASHRGIRQYFLANAPSNENDVPSSVMDAYVKSCAGYCVITYILGIGDRHQDNLLLRKTGELFHIDFGFIMGHDPKPQPQPLRLSQNMIEMLNEARLEEFWRHSFTTFLILRKHANVFANLFALMLDANIHDIASERDETVKKLLNKFRLDLDDDQAARYLKDLMDSSIHAILPQVYDFFHNIALIFA